MDIEIVPYSELKAQLKTGDLVLCHGMRKGSHITELIEASLWSHVGMVILPEDVNVQYDSPLFWESNVLVNLPDVILGVGKTGPMLVDLEQRLKSDITDQYDNYFRLVRLKGVEQAGREKTWTNLRAFVDQAHPCDFPEPDWREYLDYAAGRFLNWHIDKKNYFCSELTADTYIHCNVLDSARAPNAWMPVNFARYQKLPMLDPYTLELGPFINMAE